jgi:hypothetical protein
MALGLKNTSRKLGAALEGVKCLICRLRAAMFNQPHGGDSCPLPLVECGCVPQRVAGVSGFVLVSGRAHAPHAGRYRT